MGQARCPFAEHFAHRTSARSQSSLCASRTCSLFKAGSHSKRGWETFTTAVIRAVVDRLAPTTDGEAGANGVCFMAWGAHAAKMLTGVNEVGHVCRYESAMLMHLAEKTPNLKVRTSLAALCPSRFPRQRALQEEQPVAGRAVRRQGWYRLGVAWCMMTSGSVCHPSGERVAAAVGRRIVCH